MSDSEQGRFSPAGVMKESLANWSRYFVPMTLLCATNVVPFVLWRGIKMGVVSSAQDLASWSVSLALVAGVLLVAALSAFVYLVTLIYYKNVVGEGQRSFRAAFRGAVSGISGYLEASALLLLFLIVTTAVGSLAWAAGRSYYASPGSHELKVPVLLAGSTAFVVCLIASAWYGFFFSLAPLIAALEKKGPVVSFKESRARIRGNALRFMAAVSMFIGLYVGVGLLIYGTLAHLPQSQSVLRLIDPVLSVFLGPLGLAVWFQSYRRLTQLKEIYAAN